MGSTINAASADITAGRDLMIKTLQDTFESDNFSAGLSVTFSLAGVPTGGSANFAQGSAESLRSNAIASILTEGALNVNVGGLTEITGGVLGSLSDEFSIHSLV